MSMAGTSSRNIDLPYSTAATAHEVTLTRKPVAEEHCWGAN